MKKVISIFVVLAVVTAAFATSYRVNMGIGYGYQSGKMADKKEFADVGYQPELRVGGFDLHVGFNMERDNHLVIYDNMDFMFPGEIESENKDHGWKKIKNVASADLKSKFMFSNDLGVGYAFHFNSIRLLYGAGLHLDFLTFKYKSTGSVSNDKNKNNHVGFNFLIQGDYEINNIWSAFAAFKPSINFSDSWKYKYNGSESASGGAVSFNGVFVMGAAYKF